MVVLDTNILIAYFDGDKTITKWLENTSTITVVVMSTITVIELLCYPKLTERSEGAMNQWFQTCIIADVDISIARAAAAIRRSYRMSIPDSIIVATAKFYRASVATRDKDFKRNVGVEIIQP